MKRIYILVPILLFVLFAQSQSKRANIWFWGLMFRLCNILIFIQTKVKVRRMRSIKLFVYFIFATLSFCFWQQIDAQTPKSIWSVGLGSSGNDYGESIASDLNGNVYVVGHFDSPSIIFGSDTLFNKGLVDLFIIKYDKNGKVIWGKSIGGDNNDVATSIAVDTAGDLCITGYFASQQIKFDSIKLLNNGFEDIFLAKYSSNGAGIWAINIEGAYGDFANNVTLDKSGAVYITGSYDSPALLIGNDTLFNINSGVPEAFLAKYNSDGIPIWGISISGNGWDYGQSIAIGNDKFIYLTGNFSSTKIYRGTDTLSNSGSDDFFIAKIDSIGDFVWFQSAGGNNSDFAQGVAIDSGANIYVTGYYYSNQLILGTDTLTKEGKYDIFIIKYDANGKLRWAKHAGGSDYDYAEGIVSCGANGVCITGYYSSSSIDFGGIKLTSAIAENLFIVRYDSLGQVLWAARPCLTGKILGSNITYGIGNNIFITGHWRGGNSIIGKDTLINQGKEDVFILKLSCNTYSFSNITACKNYNWLGNSYSNSGFYYDTIPNTLGGDSILSLTLNIVQIDTSVINLGKSLQAMTKADSYKWLDCKNNYSPITWANNDTFTPLISGSYALEITKQGCIDTSDCHDVLLNGINNDIFGFPISILPNPVIDILYINYNNDIHWDLYDLTGSKILSGNSNFINFKDLTSTTFILNIQTSNFIQTFKIIKQ